MKAEQRMTTKLGRWEWEELERLECSVAYDNRTSRRLIFRILEGSLAFH